MYTVCAVRTRDGIFNVRGYVAVTVSIGNKL
jgi:hypothetical protein